MTRAIHFFSQCHFSWIPQIAINSDGPRQGHSAWGNDFLSHLFLLCKSWCVSLDVCYVELSAVWDTAHCCQPWHLNNSPNGSLSTRTASPLTWHPAARCSVLILTPCVHVCAQCGMDGKGRVGMEERKHTAWNSIMAMCVCFEMCLKCCSTVME